MVNHHETNIWENLFHFSKRFLSKCKEMFWTSEIGVGTPKGKAISKWKHIFMFELLNIPDNDFL